MMEMREAYLVKVMQTFGLKWHKPIRHFEDGRKSTTVIPFAITYYECKSAFSALLVIKPKVRNRLDAIHDIGLRCPIRNQT